MRKTVWCTKLKYLVLCPKMRYVQSNYRMIASSHQNEIVTYCTLESIVPCVENVQGWPLKWESINWNYRLIGLTWCVMWHAHFCLAQVFELGAPDCFSRADTAWVWYKTNRTVVWAGVLNAIVKTWESFSKHNAYWDSLNFPLHWLVWLLGCSNYQMFAVYSKSSRLQFLFEVITWSACVKHTLWVTRQCSFDICYFS